MKRIGIIAGSGALPIQIARDANHQGYEVFVIALEDIADKSIEDVSNKTFWINIGRIGKIIGTLKDNNIDKVIIAGKVQKTLLYKSRITPDLRAIKILFSLKERTDDAILNAFSNELKSEGIDIIETAAFSPNLITPEGILTKSHPIKEELKDIGFGWRIAKEIGRLDIGQTVVVKGGAVMAVEAIEGTDEAIIRGGKLGGEGTVVVKVSKPHQDMRLDVPTVGLNTLESMIEVKARVLAIEAGKTIIVDRERFIQTANAAGISVLGYRGD